MKLKEMKNTVIIYGAGSLQGYSGKMLYAGFLRNGWEAKIVSPFEHAAAENNFAVYQIHGAPQAVAEDRAIIELLRQAPRDQKKVVLLHRPDEVKIRYPSLGELFLELNHQHTAVVFLGPAHLYDPFYEAIQRKVVIPHGFFDAATTKIQDNPIVIGSHTTWGEMRSVDHALKLIGEIFKINSDFSRQIAGYIGGGPREQLEFDYLYTVLGTVSQGAPIEFWTHREHRLNDAFGQKEKHIVFVNSSDQTPEDFGITFNVQLYYLDGRVRTGESSGSLHGSVSIPVILEMNGAESVEELEVIKVPYGSVDDIKSIDFLAGAKKITELIDCKKYFEALDHNAKSVKKFSSAFIARSYIDLFESFL